MHLSALQCGNEALDVSWIRHRRRSESDPKLCLYKRTIFVKTFFLSTLSYTLQNLIPDLKGYTGTVEMILLIFCAKGILLICLEIPL
jgi:hypothetical protein